MQLELNTIPESLETDWQNLPGVRQVIRENSTITLLVEDSNQVLPHVFESAGKKEARITSVEIQEPNLEAVFLHLTGRALRD